MGSAEVGRALSKKLKRGGPERTQYAALPFRVAEDGHVEVLLTTSRETRRWVIPKGWPMKGLKPHKAAAREAFEETGVTGRAGKKAIGTYEYWKRLKESFVLCRVDVFALRVGRLEETWSEQDERDRRWFPQSYAAHLVQEPGLRTLIDGFKPPRKRKAKAPGPPAAPADGEAEDPAPPAGPEGKKAKKPKRSTGPKKAKDPKRPTGPKKKAKDPARPATGKKAKDPKRPALAAEKKKNPKRSVAAKRKRA